MEMTTALEGDPTDGTSDKDGRVERRHAAILVADVAGYSRLVGADDAGTLAQWNDHWGALIDPKIAEHHGRVVRIAGDGVLVEFASVVAAVRCAIEFQAEMRARNAGVPPDRRLEFRVGINVGDIIVNGGDVWGDGVIVAARLQALAEPGGICVSRRVQVDVAGKLDVMFVDLGRQRLKNIAEPVRAFRLLHSADPLSAYASRSRVAWARLAALLDTWGARVAAVATIGTTATAFWWGAVPVQPRVAPGSEAAPPALSIVVLPFANLGGDARQDYIADGITDSLTTDVSHALPGSFVVSRDTAFIYKGHAADVRRIGRELGVRYALAGSVTGDAGHMRVNAELVDTQAGVQLWADRFDVARTNLLQAQDEIVGRLARATGIKVIDAEARRSERERPRSAEATDFVMRARAIANRPTSAANMIAARDLYRQGLTVEPDNIDALAGIAMTLVFEVVNGYYAHGNEERLAQAEKLLAGTLAIEPRHYASLKAKAVVLRAQGKFEQAIAAAHALIVENPAEPWANKEIGLSSLYLGRLAEALDWFAKAERLGPRDPGRWTWLDGRGQALILLGRDEEAITTLRLAIDANPNVVSAHAFLAAAYALDGQIDDARASLARYGRVRPGDTVSGFRKFAPVPLHLTSVEYQHQRERLKEGLRRAGMPE